MLMKWLAASGTRWQRVRGVCSRVPMLQAGTDEHLMQAEHPAGVPAFGVPVGYPNHAGPGQGDPAKPGVPAISAGLWETDSIVHDSLPRRPVEQLGASGDQFTMDVDDCFRAAWDHLAS
jgi:hypothetical protein